MKAILPLARLPGSGREVDACARVWSAGAGSAVLLRGPQAGREDLKRELGQGPAVVHLATHVLQPAQNPNYGVIALGLAPDGSQDLLSPTEIATWRIQPGLIVLSGCSSGLAEALPGAGLMGLTRAWLAAGASSVLSSLWPTPDDSGALFLALYRSLREPDNAGPAAALRRASMEMLNSGNWRAEPRYWSAYFLMGND